MKYKCLTMSLFKSYTPEYLYISTLKMVNTLFVHPPQLDSCPASYFTATMKVHEWIKSDLKGIVPSKEACQTEQTIEQIHSSLSEIEEMLFGEKTQYELSIKGCCLYTESIENRLTGERACQIM